MFMRPGRGLLFFIGPHKIRALDKSISVAIIRRRYSMKTHLVFPDHRTATRFGYTRRRSPITWTRDHPLSNFGLGVLLDEHGNRFDWGHLRLLHLRAGVYLETSDHIAVRRALGLLAGEYRDLSHYIRPLYTVGLHTPSNTDLKDFDLTE